MEKLLMMILNTVIRQLSNRGVKSGLNTASGGSKPKRQMAPDERQQSQDAKEVTRRARQAANLARRLGR